MTITEAQCAGETVMANLHSVCPPNVLGAHDADFIIVNGKAYIVYEANDVQPGENAAWTFIYAAMSIVDVESGRLEQFIPFARSEMSFANETLPVGTCFVPRILRKDEVTLRCYFASEHPQERESQTWYIDFSLTKQQFSGELNKVRLKTATGTFDMQPQYLYADAVACGLNRPSRSFGMYIVDGFKAFDRKIYAIINNFTVGQNALATLNDDMDTFEVIGHLNEPAHKKLTEASVNRLPDGTWAAIIRQESGDRNYVQLISRNGIRWSEHTFCPLVIGGTNSKPTLDCFDGTYYLGWQEASEHRIERAVFNVEISADGVNWQRKYRFVSEQSFQYPTFKHYKGEIYVAVTQKQKETIRFGKLISNQTREE